MSPSCLEDISIVLRVVTADHKRDIGVNTKRILKMTAAAKEMAKLAQPGCGVPKGNMRTLLRFN